MQKRKITDTAAVRLGDAANRVPTFVSAKETLLYCVSLLRSANVLVSMVESERMECTPVTANPSPT